MKLYDMTGRLVAWLRYASTLASIVFVDVNRYLLFTDQSGS